MEVIWGNSFPVWILSGWYSYYCKFCPFWEVSKLAEFLKWICFVNILCMGKNYENEYADRVFLGYITGYVTGHDRDEIGNFLEDSGNQ